MLAMVGLKSILTYFIVFCMSCFWSVWENAISYIITTISWDIKSHAQNEEDIFLKNEGKTESMC